MSTTAPTAHQRFLDELYGRIARRYDLVNFIQSFGLAASIRRRAARLLGRGLVLDLGAGSGDLARASVGARATVICLDRSEEMLAVARRKLGPGVAAGRVRFVVGDGRRIPFRVATFDGAGSAFVFRNLPDNGDIIAELKRVIKPAGHLAIVDLFAPPPGLWGRLYGCYMHAVVPLWGRLVAADAAAYRYLSVSVDRCFAASSLGERLRAAGFADVACEPWWGGVAYVVAARAQ